MRCTVVTHRGIGALIAVASTSFLIAVGPAAAAPPTGGTQSANAGVTDATVHAYLASDDGSVTYYFEYGTTTAYGSRTADVTAAATGAGQQYQQIISGLSSSTTYHYRVRARNSSPGELVGNDFTFTTQTPPPDPDGDGYAGNMDNCPDQPGGAQGPYNAPGCPVPPDSDGDGYPDAYDSCPTKPGGAAGPTNGQGCPVPPTPADTDADDDGVANEHDDCPNTAGSRDAEGCPDRDGDGLRDSLDACPNQKGPTNEDGQAEGNGCPDGDRDGVRDTEDECPNQGRGTYAGGVRKMDDKGCPIASARFFFPSGDTWEMAHGAGMNAVCNDPPRMSDCTWRIHVSLTADSADKLGLRNRELVDRKVTTTGKSNFFQQVRGKWRWRPSAALTAALKKYRRSVTVILTGSFKVGSGEWKRMDREKHVVKPKRCGWVPYSCT